MARDPSTKMRVLNTINAHIYAYFNGEMGRALGAIALENTLSCKGQHKSFAYKGENYTVEPPPFPKPILRLLPEFRGRMTDYLETLRQVENIEKPMINAYLVQVLVASKNPSDFLALTPTCLHDCVRSLDTTTWNSPTIMTEAESQTLLAENKEAIDTIKLRLFYNLIT